MRLLALLQILAFLVNITFEIDIEVSFKTPYCIKDPLYYALEAQFFLSKEKFWNDIKNFQGKEEYLNKHSNPNYYFNPDDQTKLEYYNQLEKSQSQLYSTQACSLWIKTYEQHNQSLNGELYTWYHETKVYCGLDSYINGNHFKGNFVNGFHQESMDFGKDKILYNNLNDPEILILYIDLKQVDVIEIFNKLSHKNIVLRYKFTECLNINEHHTDQPHYNTVNTESFQALGIDIQIHKFPDTQQDLIAHAQRYKKSMYKYRLPEIFDPYQSFVLNQTRAASDLYQLAQILENHPSFKIEKDYSYPEEQKLKYDGLVTKEEFFIVNHKCVRLNRHTSDPIYINLKIIEALKQSQILSKYVENPQQLYENILSFDHKLPVFNPSFLSEEKKSYLSLRSIKSKLDLSKFSQLIKQIEQIEDLTDVKLPSGLIQVLLIIDVKPNQDQQILLKSLAKVHKDHVQFDLRVIIVDSENNDQKIIRELYHCIQNAFESTLNYDFLDNIFSDDALQVCQKNYSQFMKEDQMQNIDQMTLLNARDLCSDNSICEVPFMMINQNVINQFQLLKTLNQNFDKPEHVIDLIKSTMFDQLKRLKIPGSLLNTQTENLFDVYLSGLKDHKYQTDYYQNEIRNQYMHHDTKKLAKLKFHESPKNVTLQSKVLILAYSSDQKILDNLQAWIDQSENLKDQVIFQIVDNFNNHLLSGQLELGQSTFIFINGIMIDSFRLSQKRFEQLLSSEFRQVDLLLGGLKLKNGFEKIMLINEIKLTEYSKRNASLPDEFNCIKEYEKAANLTIALNKFKTVENPILNFKTKLNVLTRDSVNFVSLINQIKLGISIELSIFTQRSLGIEMKFIPYYYFRLFFDDHLRNPNGTYKIQNLSDRYQNYLIDLPQQKRQVFVINELSHFYELDEQRQGNQNSLNISVFGQKGYSLVFNTEAAKQLDKQFREQTIEYPQVQFYQKRVNQLVRLSQINHNSFNPFNEKGMNKKEKFMLFNGAGQPIQSYYSLLHQYLQLTLQSPGRYFLMRENTQQIILIDFYSVIQRDGLLDQVEFNSDFDAQTFRFSELDEFKTNYNFNNYRSIHKKDTVNIYYTVSGSLYEKFALYQMQQMLEQNTQEQYRFLIYEGTFCSPSFKKSIFKLKGKYSFDLDFINYPWPHDIAFHDPDPKRTINLYRIMFLDNGLPHDVDRVIYRDADQCNLENSNMRYLQNSEIKNFPQAMVPHCKHFDNKGYDVNQVMKYLGKNLTYFTNNIILIDTKRYRESDYPDIILDFYQAAVGKWGFDPFLLTQDLQSPAQIYVPIYPLDEDWEWAEDFCDPEKKKTAKIIDFQDMKKEDKLKIAKRVCPNFAERFSQLLDFLSQ
ncbi:udp-glucose:glycoprotein glucosyltransferase [Stylonychia lemnae]|uniref:Udp-glucose:glycoprotein glucosyltransferase n=1 Tax=Stylonychia lemnae TaxID=5949 RepID=A0A077ZXD2_STYLE|nr:udp-glucose:glycoprotein glucosyltransferase [Stylonychia lemnae]|eukprot:CDW74560.1 udp-glucose:glycoprotein glucosyltransferase [Stylonychia lemnae]